MRVLFLYPYAPGTVASFVRPANIIRRLIQSGIQVTLATVCHLSRARTDINLSLKEFSMLRKAASVRLCSEKGALLKNTLIVNRLLKCHDLVHFQKCHPAISLPAVWASLLQGKPVHYDWDDNETEILSKVAFERGSGLNQVREFRLFERRLVRLVDTISVASERLKTLAEKYGASADILFDAPVGADLELFSPRALSPDRLAELGVRKPMVLYQGQLEHTSFADEFVRCVAKVKGLMPDASFMVVGGGVRLAALSELATANGAPIGFTGYIPHSMVAEYVSAADVCVGTFPDDELTRCKSPLKIAEYLASGQAIVASSVGDVPRMVGDAGMLVKPGDFDGLADAIVSLLKAPELRVKLGEQARRRAVSQFNWEKTTANIMLAYRKALANRGRDVSVLD